MLRNALLVDDDNFARLDVAHELGVNQIKRANPPLAGTQASFNLPMDDRPEPVRIAHADRFRAPGRDGQGIRALDAADGWEQICRGRD